ncbi:MAG: hypothetical protein Q4G68_00840 [Planctomycetia bacterium]|nr:hypothetical protein [Planctomycetia bacterium]
MRDKTSDLRSSLVRFVVWWLLVTAVVVCVTLGVLGLEYVKISMVSGFLVFAAGFFSIVANYYAKRKYKNNVVEILLPAAIRTGIPLGAVLVFFSLFDKNIFYRTVFIVFGYYMMLLLFEVFEFTRTGKTDTDEN